MVCCNARSKTTSVNFVYFVKFKCICLSSTWCVLPMHYFATSFISPLENIGSLNDAAFSNTDAIHCIILKKHVV